MAKSKKSEELEQKITELTQDLQRTRADFENYRKRVDLEKNQAKENGKIQTIFNLLSIFDNIERALNHTPNELSNNAWVKGVIKMAEELDKKLAELGLEKIVIEIGITEFNPEYHEAISMEDGEGAKEIVVEELQPGWLYSGQVVRPAMVRVARC